MLTPYVYLSTGKSADVQRDAPTGARVALHFPELGRTIELQANGAGRYAVTDRPAPGRAGDVVEVARGTLAEGEPGTYNVPDAETMRQAADVLAQVQAGEDVGASSAGANLIRRLRATATRMDAQGRQS